MFPYILSPIFLTYMKSGFIFRPTTSRSFERVSVKFFKGILFKRRIDSTKIAAREKNISLYFIHNISHMKGGFIFCPTTSRSFERASVKFFLSKEERSKLSIIKRSERYRLNVMKQFDPL